MPFQKAILVICLFIFSQTVHAACDQTLNVGGNIAAAVSAAAANSTICLNSGNYGTVNLFDIGRSSYVTVQSTTGQSAVIAPQVGNSKYIKLNNLTIAGALQNSCSRSIQWTNNQVTDQITLTNSGCSGSLSTTFDGNTFAGINAGGGYEGRLSLIYGSGITVTYNTFGPGGSADGLFLGGGVTNVTVGPGNHFTGILEANCGTVHCDAIQNYGAGTGVVIDGNFFENGDTFLMMPDGSDGVTVKNNVFNGKSSSYPDKIQFGSANNVIFQHNSLVNVRASFDSKTGSTASTGALAENNILVSGSSFKTSGGSGCSSCTFNHNLFDANASGSNNLVGSPTFAGGSNPVVWTDFRLTSGSLGYKTASDGQDYGVTYFGAAQSSSELSSPKNLRVIPK